MMSFRDCFGLIAGNRNDRYAVVSFRKTSLTAHSLEWFNLFGAVASDGAFVILTKQGPNTWQFE